MTFVGTRIGSHEINALLGKGGMGEVYRARDTRLKRDVAIKVLPQEFLQHPERVSRFRREAEVLASLNHPNIATIYDLSEADGNHFLVLEMVEGQSLGDRLALGPMALDEALAIARDICSALEAAHEKGIVHRDLKPANVMLTSDRRAKVLDFGLAKVFHEQPSSVSLSNSPTITTASVAGMLLGTAAYMPPEVVKGQEADRTADVWAFGCVLYEMLSGRRAFNGETLAEVLASVIKTEPDWQQLPVNTPSSVRRLLRRCLHKDRGERFQHFGDVRHEIIDVGQTDIVDQRGLGRSSSRRHLALWIAATVVLAILAGVIGRWSGRAPLSRGEVRLELAAPPTIDAVSIAISPDARKIVFVATSEDRPRIWLRSLDSITATPLAGTDGGFYPFWSPDSRSIAFFVDGKLQRLDLDGGLVRTIANAPNPLGGSWNADGTIIFTPNYSGPIYRTSAHGGDAVQLTHTAEGQSSHRFPQFLPDNRHFLFYVATGADTRGVYIGSLDNPTTTRLVDADGPASYATDGYLLFSRQGKLIAQQFDATNRTVGANAFQIADGVVAFGDANASAVSTSAMGPFIYRSGPSSARRQFIWVDRSGKELKRVGEPDADSRITASLSPDGRHLGFTRTVNGNTDVWVLDLEGGQLNRMTFDLAADATPIWSPDGSRFVFNSSRGGRYDIYEKSMSGTANEELLLATSQNKAPSDWSPDGRFVLFRSPGATTGFDIWALPLDGDRKPFPVVQTPYEERDAQFSPDGKWIAYQTTESGRVEVVVQPFARPGRKIQVSTNGGAQVRWRPDGKELFYLSLDNRLMAVPIRASSDGQSVDAGTPVVLFPATRLGAPAQSVQMQQYVVSPDGQRFLLNTVLDDILSPIVVVLNWNPSRGAE